MVLFFYCYQVELGEVVPSPVFWLQSRDVDCDFIFERGA